MKKILFLLTLVMAGAAYAQKPFKMQGVFEGESDTRNITIEVGKAGQYGEFEPEETIEVKKGKFTFTKQLTEVVQAWIKMGNAERNPVRIILVPGENLKLTIKGDEYFYGGSKVYQQMNSADMAITPLNKAYTDYYMQALKSLEGKSEEEQQRLVKGLQDTLNMKSKAFSDAIVQYSKDYKEVEGAILFLTDFNNATETLAGMSESMKNGRVGKYLKSISIYEENQRKKAEEQAREEQAKLDGMKGKPAPQFTLKDINGNDFSLSSLRGKYVVLDFWGSWCGWCIKGIPDMKKYYEKYTGKFEILGIDCNDTEQKWKDAVKQYELPWLHVYNPRTSSVLQDYSIQGFPTKIIVDPEGNLNKIIVGEDPAFYEYLDELLSK